MRLSEQLISAFEKHVYDMAKDGDKAEGRCRSAYPGPLTYVRLPMFAYPNSLTYIPLPIFLWSYPEKRHTR